MFKQLFQFENWQNLFKWWFSRYYWKILVFYILFLKIIFIFKLVLFSSKSKQLSFETVFTQFITVCSSLCGKSIILINKEYSQPLSLYSITAITSTHTSSINLIRDSLEKALEIFNQQIDNSEKTEHIYINDLFLDNTGIYYVTWSNKKYLVGDLKRQPNWNDFEDLIKSIREVLLLKWKLNCNNFFQKFI